MQGKVYTVKSNAKRDAQKAIASGTAPAQSFEIEAVAGGFCIVWPTLADTPKAATFKFRSNASAEAKRLLKQGKAPARAYTIEPADGGGYRILWSDAAAPKSGKFAGVLAMLQRPEGATVPEIQTATGWLPHTTRARISTGCRQLGLAVRTEKVDGRGRVYRAA